MLLSLDIRPADDQRQTMERRATKFEILENRLERTAFSSVIEFYFRKPVCVEGDRALPMSRLKKLVFGYKEKFGIRIDKAPNQPRASDPVDLDVAPCYPLHGKNLLKAHMGAPHNYFPELFGSGELCLVVT